MGEITRREFSAGLTGILAGLGKVAAAPERTNVVYIILDDLGMYDTGCYGSAKIATPNIDRLAAEGMRFTQAYSGCTVCAPARSTLLTGKHMGHTSVRGNSGGIPLQASDFTLAQMLKKAGYACGGFGKWGVGDLDTPGVPERHGFDRFFGYYHQVHAHFYYPEYLIDTGKKVPLPGNRGFYDSQPRPGVFPRLGSAGGQERLFSAYAIHDEMKKWLRENREKPFFCFAPWTIPHARHEAPDYDPAWKLYKDQPWSMDARIHATFCTMADRFVGETVALLKELGADSNTLVLFSSDNGAAESYNGELDSAGTLRGQKTNMYEGGIRTPLIARYPGRIAAGSSCDLPVYFPDIMPTIAEFTGTQRYLPSGIDGMTIVPEVTGKARLNRERPMYWEWNEGHFATPYRVKMQACRRGKWKIVRNDVTQPWELYDLEQDPGEKRDLAAGHPRVVAELEAWVRANRVNPPDQVEPAKPPGQQWR